jgi:hypothetical protein
MSGYDVNHCERILISVKSRFKESEVARSFVTLVQSA